MSCMTSFIDHMILIRSGLGSVAIFCQFSELLVDWVQEYSSWWNYLACWDQFFLFIKLLTAVQKSRKCGTFLLTGWSVSELPSLPRLPRLQFSVHMTKHSFVFSCFWGEILGMRPNNEAGKDWEWGYWQISYHIPYSGFAVYSIRYLQTLVFEMLITTWHTRHWTFVLKLGPLMITVLYVLLLFVSEMSPPPEHENVWRSRPTIRLRWRVFVLVKYSDYWVNT